jgi:hypothetical protein
MTNSHRRVTTAVVFTELGALGSMAWEFLMNGFVPPPAQAVACIVAALLFALALSSAMICAGGDCISGRES